MDTSTDKQAAAPTPANSFEADLEAVMESLPDTSIAASTTTAANADKPESKQQGKKNARFGKNPDGTPAKKADKKEVERKSEWGRFLHEFKTKHSDMCPLEATIEARKVYIPKSGKQKSFERIFTEVWKQQNPMWQRLDKQERVAAIRKSFIKSI
jgi:hypothetical protein